MASDLDLLLALLPSDEELELETQASLETAPPSTLALEPAQIPFHSTPPPAEDISRLLRLNRARRQLYKAIEYARLERVAQRARLEHIRKQLIMKRKQLNRLLSQVNFELDAITARRAELLRGRRRCAGPTHFLSLHLGVHRTPRDALLTPHGRALVEADRTAARWTQTPLTVHTDRRILAAVALAVAKTPLLRRETSMARFLAAPLARRVAAALPHLLSDYAASVTLRGATVAEELPCALDAAPSARASHPADFTLSLSARQSLYRGDAGVISPDDLPPARSRELARTEEAKRRKLRRAHLGADVVRIPVGFPGGWACETLAWFSWADAIRPVATPRRSALALFLRFVNLLDPLIDLLAHEAAAPDGALPADAPATPLQRECCRMRAARGRAWAAAEDARLIMCVNMYKNRFGQRRLGSFIHDVAHDLQRPAHEVEARSRLFQIERPRKPECAPLVANITDSAAHAALGAPRDAELQEHARPVFLFRAAK